MELTRQTINQYLIRCKCYHHMGQIGRNWPTTVLEHRNRDSTTQRHCM